VAETGSLTIKYADVYYTLSLPDNGWLAGDLAQYIDEVIEAPEPEIAILRLLGYTMQMSKARPERKSDHWVEIDVLKRELITNSEMVRKAVDREAPEAGEPFSPVAMRRLYHTLDKYDFTVRLK
jgi:hypothetical protein